MNRGGALRTYQDAVVVITGGASGIGRALGEALARRGAEVVLADLQADLAEEVAAAIRATGGKAAATALDVRDFPAFDRLVRDVVSTRGRLDYLFNNAGIGIGGRAHLYQVSHWDRVIDINIRGVTNGVQAAYATMRNQGFGHIVNMASMAGLMPVPGLVSYSAAKHAVVGLSTSLRVEAEATGVRVSVLCPGVIRTPILEGGRYGEFLEEIDPARQRRIIERLRPMDPATFAAQALRGIAANRAVVILPARWKVLWWVNRLSPRLGLYLARKGFERRGETIPTVPEQRPKPTA